MEEVTLEAWNASRRLKQQTEAHGQVSKKPRGHHVSLRGPASCYVSYGTGVTAQTQADSQVRAEQCTCYFPKLLTVEL